MTGSTAPCPAESGLQPLRQPIAREYLEAARPAAIPGVRWDAIHRSTFPYIETPQYTRRIARGMALPRSLAARLRTLVPDDEELGIFLEDLALAVRAETGSGYDLSDSEAFEAGLPLEPRPAPQAHMQAFVHDFRRRQRQASMLVAGCVATSIVLTVVGIAALASFAKSSPAEADPLVKNSSSVVWRGPQEPALPKLILAKAAPFTEPAPVEEEASSPLPEPVTGSSPAANAAPQLVMVQTGRTLELAPLLTQRQARYILIRGLPSEANLSAGQRNPSGAWLVKDREAVRLTLSIGGAASGDYPVEVYALGASSAPQARQRLVFRVAAGPTQASAASGASGALFNMALGTAAPAQPGAASETSPLMARAMRLLGEGDLAGARLLFMHLAEQGESEAAYELARTFDAEVLTELGARGVGPDKTRAKGWYEWASETGSVKAAERLKILASLSD
jgi:TPR repeat protein